MKRSLCLVSGCLLSLLFACGNNHAGNNDGGTDMPDAGPLCNGPGCIGGPCAQDSDCTEGNSAMTAVCWVNTLLNNTDFVTTPGGYCSRQCLTNADCGTATCVSLPSSGQSFCMETCSSATTCRKPGYSCAYQGTTGGVCFPNANFNCNPSTGGGLCEYGANKYLGGCLRVAYESDMGGVCHYQCEIGMQTCPVDDMSLANPMPPQQCVYINETVDSNGNPSPTGDQFVGNLCFDQPATPVAAGMPCMYWTDCQDGYECDRYNVNASGQVCRQLCAQGGTPTPPAGLYIPSGAQPATSMCSAAGQGCANSLNANTQTMGVAGLCQSNMM
jgi:hypothetical protein